MHARMHTHTHTYACTHAPDEGRGMAVTSSLEIIIKQVHLEGGFNRGGRIRVADCLRQIVPNRWASIRKWSFTQFFVFTWFVFKSGLIKDTVHQVKHSSASLLHYLKGLKGNSSALVSFTETLLLIFKQYQKNDRWEEWGNVGVFVWWYITIQMNALLKGFSLMWLFSG